MKALRLGPVVLSRNRWRENAALCLLTLFAFACSTTSNPRHRLDYAPDEFRAALSTRVPELSDTLAKPPFEIDPRIVKRALAAVERAPLGPPRVEALVRFLTEPEPKGLGIVYDWSVTATAEKTLELRRGNCFALASVLVGLGRGIGWPIFYAEARPRVPETQQFEDVKALSDHMIVLIVAKTVQMYVDFTGLIKQGQYDVRAIDDLRAYAHLINNLAGQRVMNPDHASSDEDWQAAREGFELATRIQPELGRAWNNLGIVYRRLGRIEDAREAYHRAVELDAGFGSAQRNLSLMETRSQGGTSLMQSGGSKP
ncbi:tetratricopeptide repeat protein [Myxococcota bacterium]|nr:tetratricopeptide repeat protein [Myxococcota bacterium]